WRRIGTARPFVGRGGAGESEQRWTGPSGLSPDSGDGGGTGSENLLALGRRENSQHFPVLGYGSPGDVDVVLLQQFHHFLVAVGVFLICLRDEFLDLLLHAFAGHVAAG